MNANEAKTYERTLYEARLDAECYAVSHELHARMWRKIRTGMRVAIGFIGSAAFGGWLATRPDVAGAAGLAVALLTVIDQVLEPSEKIVAHDRASSSYSMLKVKSLIVDNTMTINQFDADLEAIKAKDPAGIDALLTRAFNRVVVAAGRPECRIAESRWQRLIAFFA